MKNEIEINESHLSKKGEFGFSDFLVDFLGALIPGLLFSAAIALTVGASFIYLSHQLKYIIQQEFFRIENINTPILYRYIIDDIGYFTFLILFLILILSYVLGQFLYRKDLKIADTASFLRVWEKMEKKERDKWVEQLTENESNEVETKKTADFKKTKFVIEFPYRYLKKYLDGRGLSHLSEIVPWDENDTAKRSKTFINKLKIKIQLYSPGTMSDIIKNEGHVRLMSSIWYLCNYIKFLSLISLALNFSIFTIGLFWTKNTVLYMIVPSLFSIIFLFLASLGKKELETFIHYQRVRELFYVLETAYTLSIHNKDIFEK